MSLDSEIIPIVLICILGTGLVISFIIILNEARRLNREDNPQKTKA